MNESKEKDDRWNELAELLGLPPEKPSAKSAPTPPSPRYEEVKPPPAPEPAPVFDRAVPAPRVEEETPRMEPMAEETGANWEAEFEGPEDATTIDESGQFTEEIVPEDGGPESEGPAEGGAPPLVDGEQPPRGRRRRRRGRRRGGDAEAPRGDAPAGAPAPRAELKNLPDRPRREGDSDPRDRRGQRGRGRRDEEDQRRPAPAPARREEPRHSEPDVVDEQPERVDTPLVAEDTDFSNWSVPPWQDLIDSLYRPDR